jgi:hypothetical protein
VCKVDVVHVSIYSGILQAKLLRNIACCVTNKEFVLGTESPTNRGFLSGECLANKVGCTPLGRDSRAKHPKIISSLRDIQYQPASLLGCIAARNLEKAGAEPCSGSVDGGVGRCPSSAGNVHKHAAVSFRAHKYY